MKKDARTISIPIRFSVKEKKIIEAEASKQNIPVSTYLYKKALSNSETKGEQDSDNYLYNQDEKFDEIHRTINETISISVSEMFHLLSENLKKEMDNQIKTIVDEVKKFQGQELEKNMKSFINEKFEYISKDFNNFGQMIGKDIATLNNALNIENKQIQSSKADFLFLTDEQKKNSNSYKLNDIIHLKNGDTFRMYKVMEEPSKEGLISIIDMKKYEAGERDIAEIELVKFSPYIQKIERKV